MIFRKVEEKQSFVWVGLVVAALAALAVYVSILSVESSIFIVASIAFHVLALVYVSYRFGYCRGWDNLMERMVKEVAANSQTTSQNKKEGDEASLQTVITLHTDGKSVVLSKLQEEQQEEDTD